MLCNCFKIEYNRFKATDCCFPQLGCCSHGDLASLTMCHKRIAKRSKVFSTSSAPNCLKTSKWKCAKQYILSHSLARLLCSAGIRHARYSMHSLYLSMFVHKHTPQWSSRNDSSVFMPQLCCVFWPLQNQRREVALLSFPSTSIACQQTAWRLGSVGHDPAQRLKIYCSLWLLGKTKNL